MLVANCQMLFRTLRPLTEGLFSNAHSLAALHFGSLQGRSSWERHKGPQTAEVQAVSGKPGLPIRQRSAGAAPCRTALTISEYEANCNKKIWLSSFFFERVFHSYLLQDFFKSMKRIRWAHHYVNREPKKSTESPAKQFASLCDLLFFFPWWSLRGFVRWSRRLFYVDIASGSTTPLRISFTSTSSVSVPNACPCCAASRDPINASAIAGEL